MHRQPVQPVGIRAAGNRHIPNIQRAPLEQYGLPWLACVQFQCGVCKQHAIQPPCRRCVGCGYVGFEVIAPRRVLPDPQPRRHDVDGLHTCLPAQ